MLHLQTSKDGDEVFLHADQEGIERLRSILDSLESQPENPEHDHLSTPAWGGKELEESLSLGEQDTDSESNRVVHHMKLYYWPSKADLA